MPNQLVDLLREGDFDFGLGKIQLGNGDAVSDLVKYGDQAIGAGESATALLAVEIKPGNAAFGELKLSYSAELSLGMGFKGKDQAVALEDSDLTLQPSPGMSYGLFSLSSQAGLGLNGALPLGIWSIGASADFQTRMAYRVYRAYPTSQRRVDALVDLTRQAVLPWKMTSAQLEQGECHLFQGMIGLDLGVDLGVAFDNALNAWSAEVAPGSALSAKVKATLKASLGIGVYDDFRVILARADTLQVGWIRLLISKTKRATRSIGTTLDLLVEYKLADGVNAILNHALELKPLAQAKAAIADLSTFMSKASEYQADSLDAFKAKLQAKLSEAAFEQVNRLIPWENLEQNPRLNNAFAEIKRLLEVYNSIDQRILSWSDELIARIGLDAEGAVLKTLQKIAEFDLNSLNSESLLDSLNRVLGSLSDSGILEAMLGRSFTSLIDLTPDQLTKLLAKAQTEAKKLVILLENPGLKLVDLFKSATERYGIQGIANRLADFDDWTSFRASADSFLQQQVSGWVGKALDQVSEADFKNLQSGLNKFLTNAAKITGAEAKLREWVGQLDGSVQIRAGMQIDHVTEESALLDLELDGGLFDEMQVGLNAARIQTLMDRLLDRTAVGIQENKRSKIFLRHGLFNSKHTKSSKGYFNMLGIQNSSRRVRTLEQSIALPAGGAKRVARNSGAYLMGFENTSGGKRLQFSADVQLEYRSTGTGLDLNAAYEAPVCDSLAFSFVWDALKPTALLAQGATNFLLQQAIESTSLPNLSSATAIRLEYRARIVPTKAFFTGLQDKDFVIDCAYRALKNWLADPLYNESDLPSFPNVSAKLVQAVKTPEYKALFDVIANQHGIVWKKDVANQTNSILKACGFGSFWAFSGAAMLATLPANLRNSQTDLAALAKYGAALSATPWPKQIAPEPWPRKGLNATTYPKKGLNATSLPRTGLNATSLPKGLNASSLPKKGLNAKPLPKGAKPAPQGINARPLPRELNRICDEFMDCMAGLDPQIWHNPRYSQWLILALLYGKLDAPNPPPSVTAALELNWTPAGGHPTSKSWLLDRLP